MLTRTISILAALLFATTAFAAAPTVEPIKIGEMMSYTNGANFATPYKEGWQFAVEEANAAGGILGRKIEVLSRDDKADPGEAVRIAQELVLQDHVDALYGAGFDHVGLAVGTFANQNHIPFVKLWGGKCEYARDKTNHYWFYNNPCAEDYMSVFAQAAAKLPYKRWAIIAPNYEFGHTTASIFKQELSRLRPDVVFVAERFPTLGKIQAQAEIRALMTAEPEAIMNLLFESDLVQYIRTAEKIGFLEHRFYIGNYLGTQISIRELGDTYPNGWFTAGIPENHPASNFFKKIHARYGHDPDMTTLEGYQGMQFVLEAIRKAGTTDKNAVAKAMVGLTIDSPFGKVTMRNDHQPDQGTWLGYTERKNGKSRFVNWTWKPSEEFLPADRMP